MKIVPPQPYETEQDMSKETLTWLNRNVLVGFTEQRGNAWHYKAAEQGDESNHYPRAIPVEDVERRLFYWDAVSHAVNIAVPCSADDPDVANIDDDGNPIKYIELEKFQAIARSDNHHVFRVFRDGYAIHQYREWLLKTVANLIDDELSIASAGLLQEGGVAWVSIELPENLVTPSGFSVRPQLLATTSHNGSLATTFKQVATAVVCDNTLEIGLGENTAQFKARHSKHSGFRLENARQALQIVYLTGDKVVDEVEKLATRKITPQQWDRLLNDLIKVPELESSTQAAVTRAQNKQSAIRKLYSDDPMVAPWKGTALGVVQAFNTYTHHVAGQDDTRPERNLMGAITGKSNELDRVVMRYLQEKELVSA